MTPEQEATIENMNQDVEVAKPAPKVIKKVEKKVKPKLAAPVALAAPVMTLEKKKELAALEFLKNEPRCGKSAVQQEMPTAFIALRITTQKRHCSPLLKS